jgi:hypothetical protein
MTRNLRSKGLNATRKKPNDGSTHWSCLKIGEVSRSPQQAAVLCFDEKSAIEALYRLNPMLPLSAGRAERHRLNNSGTASLSLCSTLDTKVGKVHGKTTARHTGQDFLASLDDVACVRSARHQIHTLSG